MSTFDLQRSADVASHPGIHCPAIGQRTPPQLRRTRQPDAGSVLPVLARLVMEVLAGRRSLAQIEPLLSPAVHARLAARVRVQYRTGDAPSDRVRVQPVAACWVNDLVCEGVVTVEHADRVTALAIRIERHNGRWRVAEAAGPEFAWRPIGPRRRATDEQSGEATEQEMGELLAGPWPGAVIAAS